METKSRVFIVCEPTRIENGQQIKSVDLSPAAKWGEIIIVLQTSQAMVAPSAMIKTINDVLHDFSDDDYIVPVGDPILMCVVASIAARNNNGRVRYLKWDRRNRDYMVIKTDINSITY